MVQISKSESIQKHLLGTKIPHPSSTRYYEDDISPAKRVKTSPTNRDGNFLRIDSIGSARSKKELEIPDSEEEEFDVKNAKSEPVIPTTQLETALPPISLKTDEEAIEAYEAYKAGERQANGNHDLKSRLEDGTWVRGRSSIYVDAFNLALDIVLEDEEHLFDDAEKGLFKEWKALEYECQYLYVRLFLRKTSKWFRIKDLQYYSDISDMGMAVAALQKERELLTATSQPQQNPGEFEPPEGITLGAKLTFAECSSDHITTLDEASSLLLLEELKGIAKEAKVQGKNKQELLRNLRRTSGKQAGLGFKSLSRTETEESAGSAMSDDARSMYEEDDNADGMTKSDQKFNRDAHYTKKILDQTGRCIRLSLSPLKLFERVHLVFYRSTEWTEKSLTTLILAKISRRNFPQYLVSRSSTIFESRSMLLEFEASLRTQFRVDNILEFNGTPNRKSLEEVKSIFEAVYPRWQSLLAHEQQKEDRVYESGEGAYLRRFSPAWVYTRIVHKGLQPLARFKEHKREHGILTQLLAQRLFHAARRGAWYQRKALLEEHYMYALTPNEGRKEEASKKHWKQIAVRTCEEGLEDRDCHIIYHYDLQKRIRKIEKQLRIPLREQHDFGHVRLNKATERDVYGIKIEREDTPVRSNSRRNSLNNINDTLQTSSSSNNQKPTSTKASSTTNTSSSTPHHLGSKTIWLDTLDTNLPVSVESMCLSHYRKTLGWKGYHSEGSILRMLFGLLFHDILFTTSYVPNVFQTPYQTCPLDLHTDAFYSARISEINQRVNDLSDGLAPRILTEVWSTEYERRTCIVGVRWDEFEFQDLLEIVSVFPSDALGTVMRVMAQEYAARGGGVPDLFLWKIHDHDEETSDAGLDENAKFKGEVMFVEVKSENDRLSDTQRLWISVLLGAGVKVELCHALASEVRVKS